MSVQEQLYELYLVDQQARGLRSRLQSALFRSKDQQNLLSRLTQQRDLLHQQLKQDQAKAGSMENEVRSLEQRIEQLRLQMNQVRNNKEYSALLVEVNTLKIEKGKLEEQALEQLTQVDRVKDQLQEIEKKLQHQTAATDQAKREADAAQKEVGPALEQLNTQLNQLNQKLPGEVRSVFNKLLDDYEGEAMASVVEENRRAMEYSCGGCYIKIPFERVNSLMLEREEIVCCPNCGRVLFLDQELRASIVCK